MPLKTLPMKRLPARILQSFEYGFTVAALILYSGGPFTVLLTGGFSQGDQQIQLTDFPIMRQLFSLSYLCILFLLSVHWKKAIRVASRGFCIMPLLAFAAASVFWSDFPQITQTRAIALIFTSLFGLYLATRYPPKEQIRVIGLAFVGIVFLSFAYAILIPKYGIMGGIHAGDWRGIYTHKNSLGKIMSFGGSILLLNLLIKTKRPFARYLYCLGLVGASALVVLSGSSGALINLFSMSLLLVLCQILRLNSKLLVSVVSALLCGISVAAFLIVTNLGQLAVMLGKDPTLTGRTKIWAQVLPKIMERPLFGHGYQGFWQKWDGESADVLYGQGWLVPHAHNGFLDLALDLGLIGLTLFILGFVLTLFRSLYLFQQHRNLEILWPVLLLFFFLIANIAENTMLKRNDLFWVLYSSSTFLVYSVRMQSPRQITQQSAARVESHAVTWIGMNNP